VQQEQQKDPLTGSANSTRPSSFERKGNSKRDDPRIPPHETDIEHIHMRATPYFSCARDSWCLAYLLEGDRRTLCAFFKLNFSTTNESLGEPAEYQ
jgi:hypothetical protein